MKKFMVVLLLSSSLLSCSTTDFNDFNGLWPHGHIPYTLTGFNLDECIIIWSSMSAWETASRGKIKFVCVQVADDKHLLDTVKPLKIIKWDLPGKAEGATTKGWRKGKQRYMFLDSVTPECTLHELAHVVGLGHEHSRPDRDLYVSVNWSLIKLMGLSVANYGYDDPLYDYTKYPYDFKSITHYPVPADLCNEEGKCIVPIIDTHGIEAGGTTISLLDADKVYRMYLKEEASDGDGD